MTSKFLLSLIPTFASLIASAQSHQANSPLDQYVQQASEFSSRARANVYFTNQQSIFDGVQFSFVSVGSGNLTFLRRDMVASGRIPLVIARVYDSNSAGTADFGPGWRLSAAETISVASKKALLTTESGSKVSFVQSDDSNFRLERDHPSDYLGLHRTAPDTFEASLRTGITKEFKLVGNEFRLTRVADRNGNEIHLVYEGGALAKISNANHEIAFTRDKSGRVNLVQDDQGRQVHYTFDDSGRLIEVDDLGGHAWKYSYTQDSRLRTALDPLQRLNFAVGFDGTGRVQQLQLPSGTIRYSYDPITMMTTVIDRKKLTTRFFQNEEGITTRVVNALGEETAIGLDSSRNVTSLSRNGSIIETMQYDQQRRIVSRHTTSDSGIVDRQYDYDPDTGALKGIQSTAGKDQSFAYDPQGNLSNASLPDGAHTFSFSSNGELTSFSAPTSKLTFTPDSDGLIASMTDETKALTTMQYKAGSQLAGATFPNHTQASYEYQPSGLRAKMVYKDGRRVEYAYDPAGNLTGTKVFNRKGKQINGQTLEMNDSYQLVRWTLFDGTQTTFRYDPNGNLTEIKKGKAVTRFEYDALDRLKTVITPQGQHLTYTYKPGERSLIEQHEHARVSVADLRDTGFTFGNLFETVASRPLTASFGSVRFSESLGTFQMANADGSEIVLPHETVEGALAKLYLFQPGMTHKALRSGFGAPFNSMFVPSEYLTINCCPECYYDGEEWYCPPCGGGGAPTPHIDSITPQLERPEDSPVIVTLTGSFSGDPVRVAVTPTNGTSGSITASTLSFDTGTVQASFDLSQAGGGTYSVTVNDDLNSDNDVEFDVGDVQITDEDVTQDLITVSLSGGPMKGNLSVTVSNSGNQIPVDSINVGSNPKASGSYNFNFGMSTIPLGEYQQIKASWALPAGTINTQIAYHFKVLGTFTQTQYNVPAEVNCTGGPQAITVWNSSCVGTSANVISGFDFRVTNPAGGTGSGHSINFHDVQQEAFCTGRSQGDLRGNATITGTLGSLSNTTVAACQNNADLYVAGTQVLLRYSNGQNIVKTVTDRCPACCQDVTHLDNFNTSTVCSGLSSLPSALTIKLF